MSQEQFRRVLSVIENHGYTIAGFRYLADEDGDVNPCWNEHEVTFFDSLRDAGRITIEGGSYRSVRRIVLALPYTGC